MCPTVHLASLSHYNWCISSQIWLKLDHTIVFFCCVNNIHPPHCQETTKTIVYLHTGGLEHVQHFTVLLVLKKSEIEDVCQELALILKIVSSQHGPCAGIKDLKFVSTDSKHELILPTCSATETYTHIKTNGGVFTSSCVWWPAADCWRGTGRVVGRAYGTSWSLCCAVLPSAALHLSLATTVSGKWWALTAVVNRGQMAKLSNISLKCFQTVNLYQAFDLKQCTF